jgi:hypothetical protein
MAFDVSALTNYVKEDADKLFMASHFDATTQTLIQEAGNVFLDVKSAETVNKMTTDAAFQTDSTCGFNASGTTAFSQRVLTVGKIKVQEELCPKNLETKYLQKKLPKGSTYTEIIYAEEYMAEKAAIIAEQLEVAIWQGDTASGSQNINKFDGFIKIIGAAAGVVNANATPWMAGAPVTTIDSTNVKAVLRAIKNAMPAKIMGKEDVKIWAGWDVFNILVDAHVDANLFAWGADAIKNGRFIIPGTKTEVVAVHGLDGTGDLYALRMSNMYLGVDILNEDAKDNFRMWYSEDNMTVRFHAAFKMGVQIAWPDEIVKFTT